jgi:hypothetical protein
VSKAVAWFRIYVGGSIPTLRSPLEIQLADDAPLSRWRQIGEFETLSDCQDRYQRDSEQETTKNSAHEDLDRFSAKQDLSDEDTANPSEEELSARAQAFTHFFEIQALSEKCIASDDPRLKPN